MLKHPGPSLRVRRAFFPVLVFLSFFARLSAAQHTRFLVCVRSPPQRLRPSLLPLAVGCRLGIVPNVEPHPHTAVPFLSHTRTHTEANNWLTTTIDGDKLCLGTQKGKTKRGIKLGPCKDDTRYKWCVWGAFMLACVPLVSVCMRACVLLVQSMFRSLLPVRVSWWWCMNHANPGTSCACNACACVPLAQTLSPPSLLFISALLVDVSISWRATCVPLLQGLCGRERRACYGGRRGGRRRD